MRAFRTAHNTHTHEGTEEENRSQDREARFVRACAIETHMDIAQEPFCVENYSKNAGPQSRKSHFAWKLTGKMPDPNSGTAFCVRLRSRNAHGHITRSILCGNLQEECRTPALTLTVRTFQCGHTVWGKMSWGGTAIGH